LLLLLLLLLLCCVASAAGDCCAGGSVFLQVVVASVQTAINCLPQLRRCRFGLVVVDEAHHSVASTYKNLLEGLGLIELDQEQQQQQQQQQQDSMYQDGSQSMIDGQPLESSAAAAAAAAAAGAGGSVGWSQVVDGAIKGEPDLEIVDGNPAGAAGWEGAMDSSGSSSTGSSSSRSLDQEDDATGSSVEADDSSSSFSGYRAVYNPNCLLVGFTATPYRLKRAESRELYELLEPVFTLNITQMINSRVLCKVWELLLLLLLLLAP